jgi:predicted dehydrogenase
VLRKHGKYQDNLLDNTVALLEFPNALGIVQSSTLQPGAGRHRTFEVQGTNGTAVIKPLEQPVLEIDLAKAAGPYQAGRQRVELPKYERYVDDFVELAAVLRGSKQLIVPMEHEIAVNDVLLRASEMS